MWDRKRLWIWGALLAVGLLGMTGCAERGDYLECSVDKDCLESEICHPDEKQCVQLCITKANCPDTAKTCEALSPENPTKICRCRVGACTGGT